VASQDVIHHPTIVVDDAPVLPYPFVGWQHSWNVSKRGIRVRTAVFDGAGVLQHPSVMGVILELVRDGHRVVITRPPAEEE
jgi:hypothetical protein